MTELPSGSLTFLFTDLESSTRLWEDHPDPMRIATARHDEILRGTIEAHGGRIFSTGGDGLAAVFGDAVAAVAAAVALQRALAIEHWPEPIAMRVRCGLHTGAADQRDGDFFGPTVNRAARVMAAANGGQTIATSTTVAVLDCDDSVTCTDLGLHRLRGIATPIHLFGISVPGEPWRGAVLSTSDVPRVHLPSPMTNFVGRDQEVSRIASEIVEGRLVTLTGVGGIGKTRLAIEVARSVSSRFADGVRFVDLAPLVDQDVVVETVATTLGVRHQENASLADSIVDWLTDQQVLLIFDNAEHVVAAVARLLERIVKQRPAVTILVTSREPLNVAGEIVWPVLPLDPKVGGTELFVARATAADAGLVLNEEQRVIVTQICERLDGMPLAIELAAARLRSLTVGELRDRLDDRFRLLRSAARGVPERQRTLQATVDWSYQLLDLVERRLFERLAIFAGDFDSDAVEAVCTDSDLPAVDLIDLLAAIVDKSMLVAVRDRPRTRYRLLETLRQYGERRLVENGTIGDLRSRHLDYFVGMARDTEQLWQSPNGNEGSRRFALDWDNLRAAHAWAIQHRDLGSAIALIDATLLWSWSTVRSEHRGWAQQTLRLATELGTPAPALYGTLAGWARQAGDNVKSVDLARSGIREAPTPTDPDTQYCWDTIVSASWDMGQFDDAAQAIPSFRNALDGVDSQFRVIGSLATLYAVSLMIDPDAASALIARVRQMAAEQDSPRVRLFVAWATVIGLLVSLQPEEALRQIPDALAVAQEGEMRGIEGHFHAFRAMAFAQLGDGESARRQYCDALTQLRSQRNWEPISWTLEGLAIHWARTGAAEPAAVVFGYLRENGKGLGFFSSTTAPTVKRIEDSSEGREHIARGARLDREQVLTFALQRLDDQAP